MPWSERVEVLFKLIRSQSLLYIPYFPATIAAIAHAVTYFISLSTLGRIISYVGRVPKHVGQATAEFLKSPMGVYQALYLTVDEMKMIKHDSWDDTIWGSSQPTPEDQARVVPLRFYFGEQVSTKPMLACA